jgi:hypothetical protein
LRWNFWSSGYTGVSRFFLFRHKLELSETISRPQGNPRLEIPRSFLDAMVACLSERLPRSCAELVFNLDEVGISE